MSIDEKNAQCAPSTAECLPLALRPLDFHRLLGIPVPGEADSARSTLAHLPYEVLEGILLQLPIQDLLLCQRVCRRFRDMVASSKPIRRALFLEPAHHNGKLRDWELLKFNPFLATQLAGSFQTRVIGVHRSKEGAVKMVAHMRFEKEALLNDDWADILLHENASWKSMLLLTSRHVSKVTQPPATLLMHPSASLFWKTAMECRAQFYYDTAGFTIMDALDCADW
ncbi:hypothetical protein N0V90_013440 [Kalmusia sp. IMI 367209]|nr:hypothetical protein N0V90_013440 [Kalmusia sp. IMI 367209]